MRCLPRLSIFIANNVSTDHLWIFEQCVIRQIFPHSSQLLIFQSFVNFQVVRCLPNLSTIIAIDLSFIDKLVIQSFVNFQIVCCSPNLSTFNANTSSSDHLFIFKQGVVRQIFPNSSWGRTKAHFVKRI